MEKAEVNAKYMEGLTPLPAGGRGELLASAPASAPCLAPTPTTTAVTVHSEGELDRVLQEQLARLRSSWSHESFWHCAPGRISESETATHRVRGIDPQCDLF